MRDIAWLTSRPIAHRGYHDAPRGVLENSPSAVEAALARGFSIEVDLQPSADGKAMVFHDDALDRLTFETGDIRDRTAAELTRLQMRGGDDRLWVLEDLLGLVDGRSGFASSSSRGSPAGPTRNGSEASPASCRPIPVRWRSSRSTPTCWS